VDQTAKEICPVFLQRTAISVLLSAPSGVVGF